MLNKVQSFVEKWDMLTENDRVIVGVSGGADSICLLYVLMELRKKIPFEMLVVHVNHRIRGEQADADEIHVRLLCAEKHIPCVTYSEDVKAIANKKKMSEEEAGRFVRHTLFEKTMEKYGCTKIATAHHQNDNAETMLFNLIRGTGLRGLGGMKPVSGNRIRPLLCLDRGEIEEYLKSNKLSYCTDETNFEDEYTRNKIRNHVLSYMKTEINPKAVEHINETMEQLRDVQDYLDEQAEQYWKTCVKVTETGYIVEESAFSKAPKVIQPLILKKVLTELAGSQQDIESTHVDILKDMFSKQVGRRADLPYEIVAKRCYEGLDISKPKEIIEIKDCILEPEHGVIKECTLGKYKIKYTLWNKGEPRIQPQASNNIRQFDYGKINGEVMVRTREIGDTIYLGKGGGTQKVKAFFINQKVPQELRDTIPVVAVDSKVFWIVGYRIDVNYQINEETETVLEIRVEEGE